METQKEKFTQWLEELYTSSLTSLEIELIIEKVETIAKEYFLKGFEMSGEEWHGDSYKPHHLWDEIKAFFEF